MFRKSLYEELDNMSYEQQKEALKLLQEDTQQYDDSCNVVEVLVEAVVNVVKVIAKNLF
jgi:vacuolar-type H+-ATPase subunit E/Vma4